MREQEIRMIDIMEPTIVEVLITDGNLWINVDGACRLRIGRITNIKVEDKRERKR